MAVYERSVTLSAGEVKTVSISGNDVTLIHGQPGSTYAVVEWVFGAEGSEHAFWKRGKTPAKMLTTTSPPGFKRDFEELADGAANSGDHAEAAMSIRKALSDKCEIEVVGPPRQATRH